jgi:hypothetical protein
MLWLCKQSRISPKSLSSLPSKLVGGFNLLICMPLSIPECFNCKRFAASLPALSLSNAQYNVEHVPNKNDKTLFETAVPFVAITYG